MPKNVVTEPPGAWYSIAPVDSLLLVWAAARTARDGRDARHHAVTRVRLPELEMGVVLEMPPVIFDVVRERFTDVGPGILHGDDAAALAGAV